MSEQAQYMKGYAPAVRYTKRSRTSLHRDIQAGRLKPYRVGRTLLFTQEMLDAYVRGDSDGNPSE